jgi:hypothetical protein
MVIDGYVIDGAEFHPPDGYRATQRQFCLG